MRRRFNNRLMPSQPTPILTHTTEKSDYKEHLIRTLGAVLANESLRVDEATKRSLGDLYDAEQPKYAVGLLEGDDFLVALRELAGV
jgi:hypothetical protein